MDANIVTLDFDKIITQKIEATWLEEKQVTLDVLRLDLIHHVISGNKWFKLQKYLAEALMQEKDTIATFGGAYSNHIAATAYACQQQGLKSVGFIRGERPDNLSHTLKYAADLGMDLVFVTRENYRFKELIFEENKQKQFYWIPEGGYGIKGAEGAAEILNCLSDNDYSHIIAAVGTGTMLAGLIQSLKSKTQVVGISSMKGNFELDDAVKKILPAVKLSTPFKIIHDYHFGGYGKHPTELINFMNEVYAKHQLPLDIIYTAKTFYAVQDLVSRNYFAPGSKVLMIHSGGLQGNQSLPKGELSFS
jgi:1-aminocyclopropane-1-carboxylate deaminase